MLVTSMERTFTCANGHEMRGIGFDDECPECEAPWKYIRCEDCYAHHLFGKSHECFGLMKRLVAITKGKHGK